MRESWLVLIAALCSGAAWADGPIDIRLAASAFSWQQSGNNVYGNKGTVGLLPVEIGLAVRLTDNLALTPFGRVGFAQAGGGVELSLITSSWSENGVVFRLAPMIVVDLLTCAGFGDPSPGERLCFSAHYFLAEVGVEYRWHFRTTSLSFGLAANVGVFQLNGDSGKASAPSYGFTGPRLQFAF